MIYYRCFSWFPVASCGAPAYSVTYSTACVTAASGCLGPGTYTTYATVVTTGSVTTSGNICATPSSSSSKGCFSGSETIRLLSGEIKHIEKVNLGDEILVSSLDGKMVSYSPVIAIPHGVNRETALFTSLITESGRQLKLTNDHILLGGKCESVLVLVRADELKVKDCVQTTSGEEVVTATSIATGHGLYTVVTEKDGLLVVNGVMASPFATNHLITNAFYNIYKFAPSMVPTTFAMSVVTAFGDIVLSIF